ncbi:unnamed protein product, partial [Vitis vinifera]
MGTRMLHNFPQGYCLQTHESISIIIMDMLQLESELVWYWDLWVLLALVNACSCKVGLCV